MTFEVKDTQLNGVPVKNADGTYTIEVLTTPHLVEAPDGKFPVYNVPVIVPAAIMEPLLQSVGAACLASVQAKYTPKV